MTKDRTMHMPADPMSNPLPPPSEPDYLVLARKLILLSLLMIVAALGLVMLLRNIRIVSLLVACILSDAVLGLFAGFSARWVLRKQTIFLRVASILAFLIGSLELLGWFTGWQIGLGPLKSGQPSVGWYSLVQLFLGTGIALLALYAWRRPASIIASPAPDSQSVKRSPRSRQRPQKRPRRAVRSGVKPEAAGKQPVEPKHKRTTHRKSRLQLSDVEEHRCPYCLELIDPDDPRGTVECKICHTLHHADCWAITGACQVPHFTA